MRLIEVKKRIPVTGEAKIHLVERNEPPLREGAHIVLPHLPWAELFVLHGGDQFLFHADKEGGGRTEQTWFGGTDEHPFLVELQSAAFGAFRSGGEEAFFRAIKPGIVTDFEQAFETQTKRQGDVFAIAVPEDLATRFAQKASDQTKEFSVFRTRHVLTGTIRLMRLLNRNVEIGVGIVQAPDHAPLRLATPHVLAQTALLAVPEQAD